MHHRRLAADASQRRKDALERGPRVVVAKVTMSPAVRELNLPADVRAFTQATIYAKVSGYVKTMRVDKGDEVKQGDVLAVLESPEVDQQVAAAASDATIKKKTYERYGGLVEKDFVSAQDYDTAKAAYGVALATLSQAKATQSYEVLKAPFDGTITLRYVDQGALIPAGSGSTTGAAPLVDLADLRTLRITLYVQQDIASFIAEGDAVELTSDERPDLHIAAKISRITRNLDVQSRAMLCEIWLKNAHGLMPRRVPARAHEPARAAAADDPEQRRHRAQRRTLVALVERDQVKLVAVETGLDDGKTLQIVGGKLHAGQAIALDLPGEVEDGAKVQAIAAKEDGTPASGGKSPQPSGEQEK